MPLCRYLTTKAKTNIQTSTLSGIVKKLSKFSSHDEIIEYSQRPIGYCYPNRMIDACLQRHSTSIDLIKMASDLHDQLLVRLAHCLCYFQSIPFLPGVNPTLLFLQERYLKSFENLTQFPRIGTLEDEEKFFQLINKFVVENNDVIELLSTGCIEAQKYFKSYEIMRDFLDNVIHVRLSMRLLAEHYLELHKQQQKGHQMQSERCGAICMKFSPAKAVQQCIDDVSSICFETYSVVPHVEVENNVYESLPFFPNIVEYILRELLKNSMRAIVEHNKVLFRNIHNVRKYLENNRDKPLCKVIIGSNPIEEQFTIAIKDCGGGIDGIKDKIFQYMFTGKGTNEIEFLFFVLTVPF